MRDAQGLRGVEAPAPELLDLGGDEAARVGPASVGRYEKSEAAVPSSATSTSAPSTERTVVSAAR